MLKLGFIGAGTVGTALAARLSQSGYPIVSVASRTKDSAQKLSDAAGYCPVFDSNQEAADHAELIFITTPDDTIAPVVAAIEWHEGQKVVHCSGADSVASLQPAKDAGAEVGAFHPLQTFASVEQAMENMPGSTFALEAEEPLLSALKELADALGGKTVVLKASDKVLYHASAVIACNYLVTLVKLAGDLWQSFGVDTPHSTQALLPLLRGTLHNIETVGIPKCLTGPIARGDIGTVNKHLDALAQTAPHLLPAYRELGRQTVPIALAKGKIDQSQAKELQEALKS
ncbi:MAG: DUF2520 domain-containing protein [Dehalococcoidia bacterium]|jgi:predicted short-subunit dehydrogenase-like oxidoreductase (DUF2520 family)